MSQSIIHVHHSRPVLASTRNNFPCRRGLGAVPEMYHSTKQTMQGKVARWC